MNDTVDNMRRGAYIRGHASACMALWANPYDPCVDHIQHVAFDDGFAVGLKTLREAYIVGFEQYFEDARYAREPNNPHQDHSFTSISEAWERGYMDAQVWVLEYEEVQRGK